MEADNSVLQQLSDFNFVEKQLKQQQIENLHEIISELKRLRNLNGRKKAIKLIIAGFLLFATGLISCFGISFNDYYIGFYLYGLIAIGVVFLIAGFMFIFD